MATAEKAQRSRAGQPLAPPDERFWKRYSPHFELPLASATALFAHGLIVGIMAVGGLAFLFRADAEASRPAKMDTVIVEAGASFPGDMGGAPAGEPGYPGDPGRTDIDQGPVGPAGNANGTDAGTDESPEPPALPGLALEVPASVQESTTSGDVLEQLNAMRKTADERSKLPVKPATGTKGGVSAKSGTGNPKGVGGAGGPGGVGKGTRPGPGPGGGGPGRKATDAEIKAWRWQFDLSGGPKEHADKLDRAGVIVAVPDPKGGIADPRMAPLLLITDIKRRPVTLQKVEPGKFGDAVKWYNTRPESVQGLAQELRLPFVPSCIVLLLPKEREAKMANAEQQFAQQNRIDFARIQQTTFDFRLQNGVYEPIVIQQR
jgi:hypothetical protein